jgi:copper chaperone CopZ
MKNLNKIQFLAALFLITLTTNAQITKAEIVATGLTCSMCSNAINKQLKTIKGVEKVDVDLNSNTFEVMLASNNNVSPKTLKDNIEKAGFFVGSMIVTLNIDNQKSSENAIINEKDMKFTVIDSKSKNANGNTKLKILNKGFVTQKEFKALSKVHAKNPLYTLAEQSSFFVKVL